MIESPVSAYYKYCNKLPVIDIGCGTIKYFDFDYVRYDRSKVYVMWGDSMKLTTTHYGDFHDMSEFKDNPFEYVISCSSLEHSRCPDKALLEWTRILNVGGFMYINYPSWLPEIIPEDRIKQFENWEKALDANDIDLYKSLGGLVDWVCKDKDGNLFLDGHFNIYALDKLKSIVPKNLELVYEHDHGEVILIYKKIL